MKDYKFAKFININGEFKAYNNQEELIKLYADGLNDLQSKIDKAIEWVYNIQQDKDNKHLEPYIATDELDEILEILGDKGEDK